MSKLFLTASAHTKLPEGNIVLVISVTDELGVPVLNVKKTWIEASHLAFYWISIPINPTSRYRFIKMIIDEFNDEKNGFYSIQLSPDRRGVIANEVFSGDLLMISVRKMGAARRGAPPQVLAEGYITIATT